MSLSLVLGKPLFRPVIKLGCARAFVHRHFLGVLERAAVGKIGGDAGRAKGVAADRCRDAGRRDAPADHPPGVGLAIGLADSVVPLWPRAVRNSQPVRSSAMPAASI